MYLEVCYYIWAWNGWCWSCKRGWDCQELMSGELFMKYLRKEKQLKFKSRFYCLSNSFVRTECMINMIFNSQVLLELALQWFSILRAPVGLFHPHSCTSYYMTICVYLTFPVQGQKYRDDCPEVTLQAQALRAPWKLLALHCKCPSLSLNRNTYSSSVFPPITYTET